MLVKIVGSIIVILGCSILGNTISNSYKKRPQEIRDLQALLQMLENEMYFMTSVLITAFEKISKSYKTNVSVLFEYCAKLLNKDKYINACEAWEKSLEHNIKKTALNNDDKAILNSFGKMLGNSDIEGQLKNIRLTITQLKIQEKKAEEDRSKNEMLYKRLGLLSGISIVIVIF